MIKIGLDMFLKGKIFIWSSQKEQRETLGKIFPKYKDFEFCEATFEAGYWRKANEIHRWFVENVQDGTDDCKSYYVEREQLKELKELCERVLKDNKLAEELLPTQEGFFFGGTEYDEWYFESLKNTIKIIDKALALPEECDFYYGSSW